MSRLIGPKRGFRFLITSLQLLPIIYVMVGVLFLSKVTQSTYEAISQNESNYQTISIGMQENCVFSFHTLIKYYFPHILDRLALPGNIVIASDCITGLEIQLEDVKNGLSNISLAIVSTPVLSTLNENVFQRNKPFIMLHVQEETIGSALSKVQSYYQNLEKPYMKWKPTILMVWGEVIAANLQYEALQQAIPNLTLYYDSNIFAIFPVDDIRFPRSMKVEMTLWEMYNIGSRRLFSVVGTTNKEDTVLECHAKRRLNFHLEKLTASVKFSATQIDNDNDWISVKKTKDERYVLKNGYAAFLYWDLNKLMNFSENIIPGDSPVVYPNGTLGGILVDQLKTGEADFTLNQISFSLHRARAFSFLQPTYHALVFAFFMQPTTNSMRNMATATFETKLWITLIAVWAILVMSMKARLLFGSRNPNSSTRCSSLFPMSFKDYLFSKESLLWSVAAVCQKSWYLDPTSTSLRMQLMIGLIMSVISYTAYSGGIVSSLAVNRVPVKAFDDLINLKFIFTVHEYSEPFQTMLRGMIDKYKMKQGVQTISTVKEISHLFTGSSNSFSSTIRSSKTAFLSNADMFYKTAEQYNYSDSFICDHISSFNSGSYLSKSGMLVKKGSQYKEVLNYVLVHLRSRGFIFRNIEVYNRKNFLKCILKSEQSTVEPTELSDVLTAILVLLVGMCLATFACVFEAVYNCLTHRNHIQHNHDKVRRNNELPAYYFYGDDYIFDAYYSQSGWRK